MIFTAINKKDIVKEVKKSVSLAKKEILATMLLKEELQNPLPKSYFNLLKKKIKEGIFLKRLGFGTEEEYNKISDRVLINSKNYVFRFTTKELDYQRLIIVDRKKMFFGKGKIFFKSEYKPLIKVFLNYFLHYFKKSKV